VKLEPRFSNAFHCLVDVESVPIVTSNQPIVSTTLKAHDGFDPTSR